MAVYVFKNGYVMVNGVDLSDHVAEVSFTTEYDVHEYQGMSMNSKRRICGVYDTKASIRFRQDTANAKVDQTLRPLVGAAAFAVKIRPDSGAIAVTNPEYQVDMILPSYTPVSGAHGSLAEASVELLGSGDLVVDTVP